MVEVLHINQSDIKGGAAIAAYRLHQGLLQQGVESRLLVGEAKQAGDRIAIIPRRLRLENQLSRLNRRLSLNYLNVISSFEIPRHPFYQQAEILNFHNLHTGYFNYLALPSLTREKPAVWTLHDMWSFTGHCAYSYDCDRWKIGCGHCPYPQEYPEITTDHTPWEWKLKNWLYQQSNLTIVTPSHWLAQQVKQSLLKHCHLEVIPYGIDLDTYQPISPSLARTALGINHYKNVLLFGVENLSYRRKGADLLIDALEKLPPTLKQETVLLTFGNSSDKIAQIVGIPNVNLGYIESDRLKALCYSAATLTLFPTRADNLPLVLQESLACATPIISFNVGGVLELIESGKTGYLAEAENVEQFTQGILELLENSSLVEKMSQNCRKIAEQRYSLSQQAQQYKNLYYHTLSHFKPS
ncbi:glycosyltransferase family 4 protein [Spirulina subsalsa]|uniref:glycosyltransferase family 4 protein n=1 Tax=Spirulina subsalsa TaxID=54311 RepID=UPI0002F5D389|nr:glycosyltransferase family 4 protein [Spirulina subsalsa]